MKNITIRIAVAAVGIPLLLIFIRHSTATLSTVIILLQSIGLWEWSRLSRLREHHVPVVGTAAVVLALDGVVFSSGQNGWIAVFIAALAFLFLWEVFRRSRKPLADLSFALLFVFYVGLSFALWYPLQTMAEAVRFAPMGAVILLLVSTWVCDTAAYFVGSTLGKHKLFPAASPNKTIEGFIAGLVFTTVVPLAAAGLGWIHLRTLDYLVLPLMVGIAGQLGDLLESLMKREAQINDSSALLPGHGGILDRFDSLLISSPILFSYLLLTYK